MSGKAAQLEKIEKTPFQLFIEANENLLECYERVHEDQGTKPKPDAALLSTCQPYKQ